MVQDLIRYDILAQEALRGVIRKVLAEVAKAGLPGNHHFFITFLTEAPGVRISSRLKEKYPEQMTIVLQHQFWDLQVTEQMFEVGLSFGDVPERLVIPFSAIRGFYDPSVNFELEFDVSTQEPAGANDSDAGIATIEPMQDVLDTGDTAKPKAKPAGKTAKKPAAKTSDDEAKKEESKPSADVVSLDAFRKNK
ncbi:SspB family protein [Phyllobacteriaceae bacterium JZ32]